MSFSKILVISLLMIRGLHIESPVEDYSRLINKILRKMDVKFSNVEETSALIKYLIKFPFIDYVEVWNKGNDVYVICDVKYLLRGFKIHGLKKWEREWLVDLLPYRRGEYYTLKELKEIEKLIVESLEADGYRVKKHTFELKVKGKGVVAEFRVVSGNRVPIVEVSINVPHHLRRYTEKLLKLRNKLFSRFKVKEMVERVRQEFVIQGYYQVVIRWSIRSSERGIHLFVKIVPGWVYKFKVIGDTEHFSTRDFLKISKKVYEEEGYISSELLAKRIKVMLSKSGLGESVVRVRTIESFDSITFLAELREKKEIFIKKIIFEGVKNFSPNLLRRQLRSSEYRWYKRVFNEDNGIFIDEFVKEDVRRIERFYKMNSFLDAECKLKEVRRELKGLTLIYSVSEGKKYIVRSLSIQPFIKIPKFDFLKTPAPYHMFERWVSEYREALSLSGYRAIEITLFTQKVEEDDNHIYLKVVVKWKGRLIPYKLGEIFFYGYKRLSNKIAENMIKEVKGDVFTADTRFKVYNRLSSLEYFKSINFVEIHNPLLIGTVDLGVALEEVKQFKILGGVGYATEEGARTFVSFSFPDIRGSAFDLILYGKGAVWVESFQPRSLFKRSNYELSILQGRAEVVKKVFFSPNWRLGAMVNYQHINRPNYEIRYLEYSVIARGKVKKGLTLITGYTFRMREPIEVPAEFSPESQFYSIGFLTSEVVYDRRNHPVLPTSGFMFDIKTDIALRAMLSESDYLKATLRSKFYFSMWRFIFSFFFRTGYAHIFTLALDIPIEEKFFLGGANTLRGFEEDSVGPPLLSPSPYYSTTGGDFMLNYGVEAQFSITRSLFIGVFFDGGGVFNLEKEGFDGDGLREGAGIGIKWKTPIGEMSADMGFKLDRRAGEKLNVFHFSIGRFI